MIIETASYNIKLIIIFCKWYFLEMPINIINLTYQYVLVISRIYSFIFLIKTFFSPWKNQSYSYPEKGFDINRILEIWTSNMVARIVGAFIRFFTIIIGLITLVITIIIGSSCLLIWVTYPILFFVLIITSFLL
jgi:hypothetical protein